MLHTEHLNLASLCNFKVMSSNGHKKDLCLSNDEVSVMRNVA